VEDPLVDRVSTNPGYFDNALGDDPPATSRARKMPARAIDSKLTAMGKDERAISVSGYVHRGLVKYADRAFEKTVIYKRHSRNHLRDQVESFRVGDRGSNREDAFSIPSATASLWLMGIAKGF